VAAAAGYAPTRYLGDGDGSAVPLISVGRILDRRWEVRAEVGRLAYGYEYFVGPMLQRAHATFAAAGLGVRVHLPRAFASKPSVFVETVPMLLRSHWNTEDGSLTRALPGLWEAVGLRFPVGRASSVEVAVGYVLSKTAKEVSLDSGPTYFDGLSQPVVNCAISLGLGD
jgi:hypothetical protein